MAKLIRTSTDFQGEFVDDGQKRINVSLTLEFVSDGDASEYVDEHGNVKLDKLLPSFVRVLNEAEDIDI